MNGVVEGSARFFKKVSNQDFELPQYYVFGFRTKRSQQLLGHKMIVDDCMANLLVVSDSERPLSLTHLIASSELYTSIIHTFQILHKIRFEK